MMCTEPVPQTRPPTVSPEASSDQTAPHHKGSGSHSVSVVNKLHELPDGDLEGAYHLNDLDPTHASGEVASSFKSLTFASIIDQIWHFCSVDYGPKCKIRSDPVKNAWTTPSLTCNGLLDTCIGYNSLYAVKINGREIDNGKGLPNGKRVWCWIILCNDGISDPFSLSFFF